MKAKHLLLATAALLLLGGIWVVQETRRGSRQPASGSTREVMDNGSNGGVDRRGQIDPSQPNRPLLPPNPNRAFEELTPEQRVQRARHPQGVGG